MSVKQAKPLKEQLIETGAQIVATACPFYLIMLEDGARAKPDTRSLRVVGIAESVKGLANHQPPSI